MRLSTRRSISRVAVLGLLSTAPLVAGWAAADTDGERVRSSASVTADGAAGELDAVRLAVFGQLEHTWLDVAPTVDGSLRSSAGHDVPADVPAGSADVPPATYDVPADATPVGLSDDEIAAIDTSGVTVTVLDEVQPSAYVAADGESITAERVHAFLDARNAPMTEQADAIVAAAITHDVDPRVIVGIAIAESNAGERLPAGSHNAWGWGGSGKFGLAHWDSWDEALDHYTARLGALYDTDAVDRSFAQIYCPPNWRWWLDTVTWVIDEI